MQPVRRFPPLNAVILLLLLLTTACGGMGSGGSGSGGNAVTITFAAWEYERPIYTALAEKFRTENPGINVVVVPLDDLTTSDDETPFSQMTLLRRVVSGADTAPSFAVAPEAFGTNLLLNLAPLMDADPAFNRADFYPGTLELFTTNSGTWALPRTFQAHILAYNQDLFHAADLPLPQAGWSWDDLLGAAEQLTVHRGNTVDVYGFLDPTNGFLVFNHLLASSGTNLLDPAAEHVHLDQPEVLAAAEQFISLQQQGVLYLPGLSQMEAQAGQTEEQPDASQLIRDGRVALWDYDFAIMSSDSSDNPGLPSFPFDTGFVPYPTDGTGSMNSSDGYIISGGTSHPNEAWKWIEFLSRQIIDPSAAGVGTTFYPGTVPARQSLAEESGYWGHMSSEAAEVYRWTLEHYETPLRSDSGTLRTGLVLYAMMQILTGQAQDVGAALREAQQQFEQQMSDILLTPTVPTDTSPVQVATPLPQHPPEGKTGIVFLSLEHDPTELRRIARTFNNEHPNIFVEIKTTPVFTDTVDLATLARNSDCFAASFVAQGNADRAALLDMQPLLDADATFPESDYPEALLNLTRHEGKLLALPYTFSMRTLNYNRTAFDAAGIEPPTATWTPDDFLAAAKALTSGTGDTRQYGYIPMGSSLQDLAFFVVQSGGQLTTGVGKDARPNYDDPHVIEAVTWYLNLSRIHKVMPTPLFPYKQNQGYDDTTYQLIQQGRAGMWFDYGYGMLSKDNSVPPMEKSQQPSPPFEPAIAPLPVGRSGVSGGDFGTGINFYISARTDKSQACWDWITYLSGKVELIRWSMPARLSLAQSEQFLKQSSPEIIELIDVYRQSLDTTRGKSIVLNPMEYSLETYWLLKALTEIVEEQADPGTVLARAQETTNAFLDCTAAGGEPGRCAHEVDPHYEGYLE